MESPISLLTWIRASGLAGAMILLASVAAAPQGLALPPASPVGAPGSSTVFSDGRVLPVPDPTSLTTDQLRREIQALRELLEARLVAQGDLIKALSLRTDGRQETVDVTVGHLRDLLISNLKNVEVKIDQLGAVSLERFLRIDTQFVERDKRTDQLSTADKTAVAAALQAAKEAVGAQNTSNSIAIAKSESATQESIKQLGTLLSSASQATNDKIGDLRARLDRGEGGSAGAKVSADSSRDNIGLIFGAIALLIALVTLFLAFARRSHST